MELKVTTERGTKTLVFDDPVITEIRESQSSPGWYIVKIEQSYKTVYRRTNKNNFMLQDLTDPTPLEYHGVRTNSQRVKENVANQLTVGEVLPGFFIQRVKHSIPQWDGHLPAPDGFYYTSNLIKGGPVDDIDNTVNESANYVISTVKAVSQTV